MTGVSQDGIFVAVFFGAFLIVTAGEIYWLTYNLQVPIRKALITVLISNFGTITLGFFVTFIIFGILLALTATENAGEGNTGAWPAFIAALAFPFLLMACVRRLLIGGQHIEQITRPLPYAIVSTLIFFLAVCGVMAIFLAFR
ncbi:MAG: hypothetical protein PSX80_12355 [bacterium]|nr:hypothetical protein [bacterium]